MRTTKRTVFAATAAAALLLGTLGAAAGPDAPPAAGPDDEDVAAGRQLFRIYCIGCHGESARGDGPAAASLRTPPADLTRISPDVDGRFPRERIFRAIEGIDATPGHERREMPLWGFALAPLDRDADAEGEVRTRIAHLVAYLETLQAPPD